MGMRGKRDDAARRERAEEKDGDRVELMACNRRHLRRTRFASLSSGGTFHVEGISERTRWSVCLGSVANKHATVVASVKRQIPSTQHVVPCVAWKRRIVMAILFNAQCTRYSVAFSRFRLPASLARAAPLACPLAKTSVHYHGVISSA